jgi:formylmethanofuran dehydrogenase subunit E
MTQNSSVRSFDEAVRFHGHACPGLALGYRAAIHALSLLESGRDEDEELVAIVENDACGIDAIQVVTGCTVGKGNLILRDLGKHAYTFVDRSGNRAFRIVQKPGNIVDRVDPGIIPLRDRVFSGTATPEEREEFRVRWDSIIASVLDMPDGELFSVRQVKPDIPEKARIFRSVQCAECQEMVGEHRARVKNGRIVCLSCSDEYSRGW